MKANTSIATMTAISSRMRLRRLIGRRPRIPVSRVTFPPSSGAAIGHASPCRSVAGQSNRFRNRVTQAVDPDRPDPGAGEEADEDEDRQGPELLV